MSIRLLASRSTRVIGCLISSKEANYSEKLIADQHLLGGWWWTFLAAASQEFPVEQWPVMRRADYRHWWTSYVQLNGHVVYSANDDVATRNTRPKSRVCSLPNKVYGVFFGFFEILNLNKKKDLNIEFKELVYSNIRYTDFKFSKKSLNFLYFFRIFRIFLGGVRGFFWVKQPLGQSAAIFLAVEFWVIDRSVNAGRPGHQVKETIIDTIDWTFWWAKWRIDTFSVSNVPPLAAINGRWLAHHLQRAFDLKWMQPAHTLPAVGLWFGTDFPADVLRSQLALACQ